jgi:hypothetical protein
MLLLEPAFDPDRVFQHAGNGFVHWFKQQIGVERYFQRLAGLSEFRVLWQERTGTEDHDPAGPGQGGNGIQQMV